jgi:hypothetical protein
MTGQEKCDLLIEVTAWKGLTVFKFDMRVYFVVDNSYSITSAHNYYRLNLSRQCHLIDYI